MWSYRARVTKVHKYARRETSPVVVSECECLGQRVTTPFIRNKGTTGNSKLFSVNPSLLIK